MALTFTISQYFCLIEKGGSFVRSSHCFAISRHQSQQRRTIKKHKLIIADNGYCWWGWLFREYEQNPSEVLSRILIEYNEAGSDEYPVVLYDTGQGRLYVAQCDSIMAWPNLGFSPEVEFTPDYYRQRRAPAWFRFRRIEEAEPELIVGKVCSEMPSAVEDCFTDLLEKSVSKIQDLRRQEVTLWILR